MNTIKLNPIGYIKSPFKNLEEIPPQNIYAKDKKALIEIKEELVEGLKDLDKNSHIIILFYFNKSKDFDLITKTPWSDEKKGVFSTRSPRRPNPIGLSIVKLIEIDHNKIIIKGIDMLDGTPVLDIKPYSEELNP
ncbi:TPA: tRNA (N6-threonylcarbamoyladenosine(37)-N6)-methyltransferase TrmO [Clostridium botulinum]|uniref:tRNA (N6-threonylcarbamoyladenosine(37)-N6)-methyltransferase TrmO n=1 Tax=Clostridium botulinum TaxID=1491 RepID=UPI000D0DBDCF|nr:tRNA (N6-threonylcarbamoyladenosine(37)-N6)-methyltransferase TrmO [Clostridium botulinum]PSM02482.1 tRNA (N6-threonylcarbamoyladenosine(37)-N6)-methyltransferase TrmO [Clostridium botulinum]HDK7136977.1 tRNA (N6-threonylcarbamoyladenosine(37)-N6)-methyltransferase TrmO [Clostridium botulinum]HDK7140611.1 tRNA (N6-threonylcarbamoyladenosine(37)-N6)-methyltransferase TrmO [Clostridium botulinum]HDK7144673.1 tRNA (N6-threonylcarbamoyladenosine(37)-N6)-methyltransferase TrmO [Clostridium botuli